MALDTSSKDMKLAGHGGILFMAYPIRPQTTSSVHISGGAPEDAPVIDARFLETEADRAAVAPCSASPVPYSPEPPDALIRAEEFPGPAVATGQDTVGYSPGPAPASTMPSAPPRWARTMTTWWTRG